MAGGPIDGSNVHVLEGRRQYYFLQLEMSETLRAISVLTSAVHLGSQWSLSFVSGAALLASPTASEASLLAQFKVIFRRGFVLCPPFAAVATLANLTNSFLSWRQHGGVSGPALTYFIAGVSSASLVPFTLLYVVPTEEVLLKRAAQVKTEAKQDASTEVTASTTSLIREWARLNYWRVMFPIAGILLAYTA